ncbi:MAG: TraB/VirB10 family protein [Desulfobacteraceae bacterium]|nr:TraB/VirB10 family protein [Desulfobacteraceae bacterium]
MNILREKFNALTPRQKRFTLLGLFSGVILILAHFHGAVRAPAPPKAPVEEVRQVRFDGTLLERSKYRDQERQIEDLGKQVAKLNERLSEKDWAATAPGEAGAGPSYPPAPAVPTADEIMARPGPGFPPPERAAAGPAAPPPSASEEQPPATPPEETMVGGIMVVEGAAAPPEKPEDKKKERALYLPPSFMEAELLTGFDASTMGAGDSNPEPLLLRIQAPAVLPNRIKAGLQGCFMVAEATGKLNKERADVRLVNLACLDRSGEAVIDSKVKGFVVGSDGKVGLAGLVVSRMGAATARAVIAGIFGGAGEALQSAGLSQSVSPLGTTSSVNPAEIAKTAGGKGLAGGADTLRDFYLQLAKQTTPVIEVGPTQKVTAVIAEGVELKIKNLEQSAF